MEHLFLLLGPSGSGKGTQAKLLSEKFELEYIETGELLRNYQNNKSFSAEKLITTMNRGDFVPSFFVAKLWLDEFEKFKNNPNIKGLVLDGFCRQLIEAKIFAQALTWYEWDEKLRVFFIKISKQEAVWRLSKRKVCKDCKRNIPYLGDLRFIKKCDNCGGELKIRVDDNQEAIIKRWENFDKETVPVIDFFSQQGKVIEINGEQPIEAVFKDILLKIKNP